MIIQGSNLPLYFSNIPVALDTIADISILLCAEKGICLKHWGKDDITISEGGILAPITQAESMRFPEGRCSAEIKFTDKSGMAIPGFITSLHVSKRYDRTPLSGEQPQTLRYVDIDCSGMTADIGAVVGASAYELAVKDGFTGTKEEWLESLRYDHSEEFTILAEQVGENANTASEAARMSVNAANTAANAANSANTSAERAAESERNASASKEAAAASERKAKDSETAAGQSASNAADSVGAAATAKNEAEKAKNAAELAAEHASTSEANAKESEEAATKASADAVAAKEEIQASADQIAKNKTDIGELKGDLDRKINTPKNSDGTISNGISGQILQTNGDGTTKWVDKPSGSTSTGGIIEETDPTVPDWAKNPKKPTYTASEVGALPDTTKIPSKTSDLQNDSGFLTQHQDLSGYALNSEIPKVPLDIGAESEGTAESKVSEHNVSDTAHNDIRLLVQGLAERLNTLADSDDETLDQMSEVVAYIKSNKSLIDAITTSKINVSDIIDNLTTNVSNKPLSAAQGVALKALIDDIPKTSTGMERIEKLSTDTAVELEPNKLYIFPEMAELAITLAEPSDTGIANEYHVVFQSGSTPTAFMIPSAINLPSEFAVEANNVYRISILEGCLTAYSWYTIPFVFHVKIDSSLDYPYLYCWESYKNVDNTIWGDVWPGEPMLENENGWFTRELPPQQHSGNLHCIVTNEAGNNQTLDIDIDVSKSDVWITVNASYEYMVYYEEPVI